MTVKIKNHDMRVVWNDEIKGVFGSPGLLRKSPLTRDFDEIRCLLDRFFPPVHC
jgi:hypothetical protein